MTVRNSQKQTQRILKNKFYKSPICQHTFARNTISKYFHFAQRDNNSRRKIKECSLINPVSPPNR